MSGFDINIFSKRQEFHRFSTDDFALAEIGIGGYNLSSLSNFFGFSSDGLTPTKPMNPDIREFFSGQSAPALINEFIGQESLANMQILEFDQDTKTYKEVRGFSEIIRLNTQKYKAPNFVPVTDKDVKSFLTSWNNVQLGILTDKPLVDSYKAVVYKIQNSVSGCITFDVDVRIIGYRRTSKMKLHLLDSYDNESSREMSFKGSPFITAPPTTSYGATHSFRGTDAAPAGAYVSTGGDEDSPENTVSGKMRMVYDKSTGEWESGTQQMLFKLVDEITTSNMSELPVDDLESLTREDFYGGIDKPGFMGNFSRGRAIPLSAENGNPHLFGPDFKDGCEGDKKVEVTLINRLNQSYRAGSVVVASRMAGENGKWVITSPGTPGDAKKGMRFGNFEYQQYLIPMDYYFAYKTANNSYTYLSTSKLAVALRHDYYTRFDELGGEKIDADTQILNLMATSDLHDQENPEQYLIDQWLSEGDNSIDNESFLGTKPAFEHVKDMYKDENIVAWVPPSGEYQYPVQKNANQLTLIQDLGFNPIDLGNYSYRDSYPSCSDLMGFWGTLFPNGYKPGQSSKFKKLTNTTVMHSEDRNLTNISSIATICIPNIENEIALAEYVDKNDSITQAVKTRYLDYVRKTGGFYTYLDFSKPGPYVASVAEFKNLDAAPSGDDIWGLEPIYPGKLQFTSLPLESLFSASDIEIEREFIDNPYTKPFRHLQRTLDIDGFGGSTYASATESSDPMSKVKIADHMEYWVWGGLANQIVSTFSVPIDAAERRNNGVWGFVTGPDVTNPVARIIEKTGLNNVHTGPLGVLDESDGDFWVDTIAGENNGLISCMPVLFAKSHIITNAESLVFEIDQFVGAIPKFFYSAVGEGLVISIPTTLGLSAYVPGGVDRGQQYVAHWGDANRADDPESTGTTTLHVKIFEHWPIEDTVSIGALFTPLHYNTKTNIQQVIRTDDDGNFLGIEPEKDSDGIPLPDFTTVDFRIPTGKNGQPLAVGDSVNPESLAPYNEWIFDTQRRGKLLTAGGYAYFKTVLAVKDVKLATTDDGKPLGGFGYAVGDTFQYRDGSEIEVTSIKPSEDDPQKGAIDGYTFTSNIDESKEILKTSPSTEIQSANNLQPSLVNGGGGGARFEPTLIVTRSIKWDSGPKEIVPETRVSKSSSQTAPPPNGSTSMLHAPAYGKSQVSVSLEGKSPNNNSFDIFYFYHNDPTHYSVDVNFSPFYIGCAQFITSEVRPA